MPPSAPNSVVPHVIVELWSRKTDDQKQRLTETITRGVMGTLENGEDAVSVAFEEVEPLSGRLAYTSRTSSKSGPN